MVIVSGFQTILLYACLGMLGALALFSFMALVCEPMKRLALRIRKSGHLNALLALLAVTALVAYGGTKPLPVPPEGAEFRMRASGRRFVDITPRFWHRGLESQRQD